MAQISRDEVKKLAELAKLSLTDDELDTYQKELDAILGYVKQLEEVDTANIQPTSQVTGLVNADRKDEVLDYGVSPAELLETAPESQDGYIKVRKVL